MATPSSARPIDVRVFPAFRSSVRAPWLRRVARAALAAGDPDGHAGASVAVAGDDTLHELNARFRGLDEPTDVLSFANADVAMGEPAAGAAFPSVPGETPSLGEVVLSYPLAMRQAGEHNVTVEYEVALLVVHGVLHLLGHDHEEPGEEAVMKELEARALGRVFANGGQASGPRPGGGT